MTGFLDLEATAEFLCRSRRWVRGNLSWLPHFRVNSQLLFRPDELLRAMERFRAPVEHIDLGLMMMKAGLRPRKRESESRTTAELNSR